MGAAIRPVLEPSDQYKIFPSESQNSPCLLDLYGKLV